jgi:helix-turn-helix protein
MDPLESLLTETQYAEIRRCSKRTAQREREDGSGCPWIQFGRQIRYRKQDILAFITAHTRHAAVDTPDKCAEGAATLPNHIRGAR